MTCYSYTVPYANNDDIDRINEIRQWLRLNVKSGEWNTYTTQRSEVYTFNIFKKKNYVLFLLRWA